MVLETFTWKIIHFSLLEKVEFYYSDEFSQGGINWKLQVGPGGDGDGWGSSLAFYMSLSDATKPGSTAKAFTKAKLRVLNQRNTSKHLQRQLNHWFETSNPTLGFQKFVPLKDLSGDGYLVNDTLILQAEFEQISKA